MKLHLLRLGTLAGIDGPVPGYLIQRDDGTNVLVDTGYNRQLARADDSVSVTADEDVGAALARVGLQPHDIHLVVCTHLDPDHAGNHDRFPHAEFVVQRQHWEAALSGDIPRITEIQHIWDLPGMKLRLVDGDAALFDDVTLVESSGHVPGHQSVLVRLPRTGPVLLAADAIPLAIAADPDERPILPYDLDEAATRVSTAKLVALAEAEGALVVYGHDPMQWSTLRTSPQYYD